jgi:cytochrome b561
VVSNTETRYGSVAKTLHWLIALAIIGLLVVGKYMTDLTDQDPNKFALYQLHKSFGISVLALSVVRVVWRLMNKVPALPVGMPRWQRLAAHASHGLLYFLMLAIPLSGWAMVSASTLGIPTLLFGAVELPNLPITPDRDTHRLARFVHEQLGNVMIGLAVVHVLAALKHHFFDRDTVLTRMLPFGRG